MISKNIRQWVRLQWNKWNLVFRYDVLIEHAVTIKYWRSIRFGEKCTVQSAAYLYGSRGSNSMVIGNHVVISNGCMVLGEGGVSLGDYTHLGPLVVVTTQYGDSTEEMCTPDPIRKYAPVTIGKGCWIGTGSVIMPGTILGSRCVVAPNSVVYGEWGDGITLAGNPARRRQ